MALDPASLLKVPLPDNVPPELLDLHGNLVGSTLPRIFTPPLVTGPPGPCICGSCALTPETSYGFEAIEFSRDTLGRPYDPWQEFVVVHAGELLPNGIPRFNFVLIIVARQNGKTEIPVLLVPYWLFLDEQNTILGTSTKLEYAKISWFKALRVIENVPDLAAELPKSGVKQGNNLVEMRTVEDRAYVIAAANRNAGRSLTLDKAILDELREHYDYSAYDAAINAGNAVEHFQAWALTNQGDARGVVLDEMRDSVLTFLQSGGALGDARMGLFEWSAPDGSDPEDPIALARANPNLNRRRPDGSTGPMLYNLIGRAKQAKIKGGDRLAGFKTEVMCMRVRITDPAISEAAWSECEDPGDMSDLRGRIALCLDVAIDGLHATLCSAAKMDDDRVRVEVVKAWDGEDVAAQVRRDLPDLVRNVRPRVFGWFPGGPAASLAAEFVQPPQRPGKRQVRRKPFGSSVIVDEIRDEVTAVCMGLSVLVSSRDVAHSGDPLLTAHCTGAERLWQGDAWRFVRRGAGHCDAAYATGGAVHLARTLPKAPPKPQLAVAGRAT
jgi:hypothetical protein